MYLSEKPRKRDNNNNDCNNAIIMENKNRKIMKKGRKEEMKNPFLDVDLLHISTIRSRSILFTSCLHFFICRIEQMHIFHFACTIISISSSIRSPYIVTISYSSSSAQLSSQGNATKLANCSTSASVQFSSVRSRGEQLQWKDIKQSARKMSKK